VHVPDPVAALPATSVAVALGEGEDRQTVGAHRDAS